MKRSTKNFKLKLISVLAVVSFLFIYLFCYQCIYVGVEQMTRACADGDFILYDAIVGSIRFSLGTVVVSSTLKNIACVIGFTVGYMVNKNVSLTINTFHKKLSTDKE